MTGLPGAGAPLVGRARELSAIRELLTDDGCRLLTLSGSGGIGKTALALTALTELDEHFEERAWLVDLAPLTRADMVLSAICSTLGVHEVAQQPIERTLARAIGERSRLLVLDNFEHVLDAGCTVAALLEHCPRLTILVTSRTRLNLARERELVIQPLEAEAACELFALRAQQARADFRRTSTNESAITDICARLDGIPLALELAAARIKLLAAEQIARRLEDRFALLTCGPQTAPARQRTLRATLDWSYQLLGPVEQSLLRRLGVFASGATLDAVERVCADPELPAEIILDTLGELVDQSLVVVRERDGEARYGLLETVRQYATERLHEAGEQERVRAAHAAWFLDLAERARHEVTGADQTAWLDRLEREHDNLRAALAWSIERIATERALLLGCALWKFWELRGHAPEGLRWMESALAQSEDVDPSLRSRGLHGAGILAWLCGDYSRATELHQSNLVLRRALGDQHGEAVSLLHLANVLRSRGEAVASGEHCEQSLCLFRALDDTLWIMITLNSLGLALLDQREFGRASEVLEESLTLVRELGGLHRISRVLNSVGDAARMAGDYERAESVLHESIAVNVQLRDAVGAGLALESLGHVASARGQARRSAGLLGMAEAQRRACGAALPDADQPEHESAVAALRRQLGSRALQDAWERGAAVALEDIESLLEDLRTDPIVLVGAVPAASSPLTEREREVAALLARGLSNKQIAERLVITKQTTDKHVANILGKLSMSSRAQVAVWAVQQGLHAAA